MINFADDSFFNELIDQSLPSKRSAIKVVPIVNHTNTNEEENSCDSNSNNSNENNVYDFSQLSDKEFYELYSCVQDKKNLGKFDDDDNDEVEFNNQLESLLSNNNIDLNGVKIPINKKNKYGDLEMPSFETVKSQRLDENDIKALSELFDSQFLEEGDYPYNGFHNDFKDHENKLDTLNQSSDSIYNSCSSDEENDSFDKRISDNHNIDEKTNSSGFLNVVGNVISKIAIDPSYFEVPCSNIMNRISRCGPAPFITKKSQGYILNIIIIINF